jgi:hypothetical protein
MKVSRCMVSVLMASCIVLCGGIWYQTEADESWPDGFKILREKMEKNEIPTVDFGQFRFALPDEIPDEINSIKGFLWSGRNTHPAYIAHKTGAVAYLFLINYNKVTEEMTIFYTWGAADKLKPGATALRGKASTEDKNKIELKSRDGSPFTLLIKDKDHLTVRAPSGYEGDLKKIGTISPPPK